MNAKRKRVEALERALFAARRLQAPVAPGARWQEAVMGEIRRLALASAPEAGPVSIGQLALRLSAVAACVAIVLLVYAMSRGFVDYEELAMRFLEDPASFLI